MKHLAFGPGIAIVLISLITACRSSFDKNDSVPPNFIVILTDDQSWVSTSCLSDPNETSRTKR